MPPDATSCAPGPATETPDGPAGPFPAVDERVHARLLAAAGEGPVDEATLAELVRSEGPLLGAEAVTINYGRFITTLISFLIVAWVIFWLVKIINRLKRAQEADPKPAEQPADVKLLTEIRDLLKARQ